MTNGQRRGAAWLLALILMAITFSANAEGASTGNPQTAGYTFANDTPVFSSGDLLMYAPTAEERETRAMAAGATSTNYVTSLHAARDFLAYDGSVYYTDYMWAGDESIDAYNLQTGRKYILSNTHLDLSFVGVASGNLVLLGEDASAPGFKTLALCDPATGEYRERMRGVADAVVMNNMIFFTWGDPETASPDTAPLTLSACNAVNDKNVLIRENVFPSLTSDGENLFFQMLEFDEAGQTPVGSLIMHAWVLEAGKLSIAWICRMNSPEIRLKLLDADGSHLMFNHYDDRDGTNLLLGLDYADGKSDIYEFDMSLGKLDSTRLYHEGGEYYILVEDALYRLHWGAEDELLYTLPEGAKPAGIADGKCFYYYNDALLCADLYAEPVAEAQTDAAADPEADPEALTAAIDATLDEMKVTSWVREELVSRPAIAALLDGEEAIRCQGELANENGAGINVNLRVDPTGGDLNGDYTLTVDGESAGGSLALENGDLTLTYPQPNGGEQTAALPLSRLRESVSTDRTGLTEFLRSCAVTVGESTYRDDHFRELPCTVYHAETTLGRVLDLLVGALTPVVDAAADITGRDLSAPLTEGIDALREAMDSGDQPLVVDLYVVDGQVVKVATEVREDSRRYSPTTPDGEVVPVNRLMDYKGYVSPEDEAGRMEWSMDIATKSYLTSKIEMPDDWEQQYFSVISRVAASRNGRLNSTSQSILLDQRRGENGRHAASLSLSLDSRASGQYLSFSEMVDKEEPLSYTAMVNIQKNSIVPFLSLSLKEADFREDRLSFDVKLTIGSPFPSTTLAGTLTLSRE